MGYVGGIESLFLDMNSRGFDVCSSHLRQVNRLLLVSIGLYWCVSFGADARESGVVEKKRALFLVYRGLAFFNECFILWC